MIGDNGYSIRIGTALSPEAACRALRTALRDEGLEVSNEVDLSRDIEKHIGLSFRKYFILSVWSPIATYQALLAIPEAGIFVPFHIAVTSRDGQTFVMAMNPNWLARWIDRIGFRLLAKDVSARLNRALRALDGREAATEGAATSAPAA